MAETKRKKIPGTCVFCSNYAEKGWDKRGRAFILCRFCGAVLFMGTALAEAGHSIIHDMVNANLKGYKDELEKRLIEVRLSSSKVSQEREIDHELRAMGVNLKKGLI